MGKYTRYSNLLVNVMSEELREKFFSEDDEDTDAGWDLFETLHPDDAESLMEVLRPLLEDVVSELKFRRDHNKLLGEGDEVAAVRLSICHQASKLKWDRG